VNGRPTHQSLPALERLELPPDDNIDNSPVPSEKPYRLVDIEQMMLPAQKIKQVIGQVLMVNGCEDLSRIEPIYA